MKDKLNILFIGKYPPIEGGESTKLYWLARGLGEKGHNVYIVSNCQEIEDEYRCVLRSEDLKELQPRNVKLFSTSPLDKLSFIPSYNPLSEKLSSLAIEVCESYDIDIIIGWYLLPYAVAAFNVSKIKNKKFVFQHAGSDINRLLTNQFLYKYLQKIISEADAVMSYPATRPLFESVRIKNIFIHLPKIPSLFNPNETPFNLEEEFGLKIEKENTFLFLGKLTKRKGLEYLLESFQKVSNDKNLLIFGRGKEEEYFKLRYKKENIHYFNPIPPWRVSNLIKSCTSVILPEYNFGIKQHKSRIPLETILCGEVPIISYQISSKYGLLKEFFIEINPTDINSFSSLIENSELIREKKGFIEKRYSEIKEIIGSYEEYIDSFEEFLLKIL